MDFARSTSAFWKYEICLGLKDVWFPLLATGCAGCSEIAQSSMALGYDPVGDNAAVMLLCP